MTNAQRIALRLSEVRQRLNEIAGLEGDALTDEVRAEAETLQTEYRDLETRHRAAIVAAGEEEQRTRDLFDDPESRELARLESRASLGGIFSAAIEHRQTDGETAELQQHLNLGANQIPLALLREPVETRAVTPAPTDVGQTQSTIIPGVFPRAAASWMSVDMPTVPVGDATFPVLATNAAPGTPAKGAEQAETTGSFTASVLTPGRIQASFFYNREDRARFAGMDESLRMNLSDALSDKLDERILNLLFTSSAIAEKAATAVLDFSAFRQDVYERIDGTFAWGADDLRILVGAPTLGVMAKTYLASTDSMNILDHLTRDAGGLRVSAHVPAVASNKQDALIRRGMRRDAISPVWEGVTLIPDEVTKAGTGQIVVTAVLLYAATVLRGGGFYRIETQHA